MIRPFLSGLGTLIAAKFYEQVAGRYYPGRPIGLSAYGEEVARWVHQHEMAHATLTESTTLGSAAVLSGLVCLYTTEEARRRKSERYLERFCSETLEAQEGTATACALSMGARFQQMGLPYLTYDHVESALPRTYLLEAAPVLEVATRVLEQAAIDDADDVAFLHVSLVLGFGIAAMSPPVAPDFYRSAMNGTPSEWVELEAVRTRFNRLKRVTLSGAIALARSWAGDPARKTPSTMITTKKIFATEFARAAGLAYEEPPPVSTMLADHVPDLLDRAEIVHPGELDEPTRRVFFEVQHPSLIRPERVRYVLTRRGDAAISRLIAGDSIGICEVGWIRAGTCASVHYFDPLGAHRETMILIDQPEVEAVIEHFRNPADAHLTGEIEGHVVVSMEAFEDAPFLVERLSGCRFLRVALHQRSFKMIADRQLIAGERGVGLYRTIRVDGTVYWEAAPLGVRLAPTPTPVQRAYLWVLANGLNASLRWSNYRIEEVANE